MIDEVVAFRAKVAKAAIEKDFTTLRAAYAESFTHTHGSGKVDGKNDRIVAVLAGDPVIENAPTTELVFRVHTGPTAVYVTAVDGWQLAVSQATRLPPPP